MRILLTNDDGVRAPGIIAMYEALTNARDEFDAPLAEEVVVCAPLTVQSATSHGVTFHQPLMVSDLVVDDVMPSTAIDGRPADCVKLALTNIWADRFGDGSLPDLVISGMNSGANVGMNVIYSGTVAAALEAAFLGVPSIAVSLHLSAGRPLYDIAARHARVAIERILETAGETCEQGVRRLDPHTCLNMGIPRTEQDGPTPPIRICPMNIHGHIDNYERRVSPGGDTYYWSASDGLTFRDADEGADVDLMFRRFITVTPLSYDLTAHEQISRFRCAENAESTSA